MTLASLLLAGCVYGFAGGGLPSHIRTVAVLPFDNETPAATLQRELYDELKDDVENRLGLRSASEGRADAVVRGRIRQYEADIPVAYSADPEQATTAQRKLRITLDVEIVDQGSGNVIWARQGLVGEGTYTERGEEAGRAAAIEKIVNEVIAGAQSQW